MKGRYFGDGSGGTCEAGHIQYFMRRARGVEESSVV